MSIVKAEGLIMRAMKMGETSKLVTLFTRELGFLKVIAKGSRMSKSRFGAALEPLTVSRIVYYDKETRDLQFLSHAEIAEHFPNLSADLERWGFANACCELVERTHVGVELQPKLYPVLLETLRAMNTATVEARLCFWRFQMRVLDLLGFAPNFKHCQSCGAKDVLANVSEEQSVYHFDVAHGGVLCERCAATRSVQLLSGGAARLLESLQTVSFDRLARYKVSPPTRLAVEHFFQLYFAHHWEEIGNLSALKFVREIKLSGNLPPK